MAETLGNSNSSELIDAKHIEGKPTFFGGAVFFMVCLIAIFANVAFGGVHTGILGIISILTGLLVIFWFLDAWKTKTLIFSTNTLLFPIVGLILIGIIQLMPFASPDISSDALQITPVSSLSLDPYSTRLAVVKLILFLIFFAAALTFINSQNRLRKIVVTIIVFGSIMSFFGVMQKLGSPGYIYGIKEPIQAIPFASFVNQHHFASFMLMTISLTMALLIGDGTKKDKFLLLGIAVILMGIAIVFTTSRGGLLSLIGVIGFIILISTLYRKSDEENTEKESGAKSKMMLRNLGLIGGSVVLIAVLFLSVIFLGGGDLVLSGTGIRGSQTDFTNGRTHFWSVATQIIRDNPIIGSGLESFGVAFTKYDTWSGRFRVEQAHNEYLQILADAGILGLLCVIAFIILFFRQSLKIINNTSDSFRKNVAIGALAGCFGIMIHSFFDFPLRTNANMFFFLIFVSLSVVPINYSKLYRKRVKVRKKKKA